MKKIVRKKDYGSTLMRYKKSFFHAIDGIVYAIENEHNVIIMMICAILVFITSFLLPISMVEIMILIVLIASIMACEMINSAIEAAIDLVTTEENELAKIAKDLGGAASLILSVSSIICALIIFLPKVFDLFLK